MKDSEYLRIRRMLKLKTSAVQDYKCMEAEAAGLRFCVDYGYATPAEEIKLLMMRNQLDRRKEQ